MVQAMDAVGVDGAIFVSAFSLYRFDASYAVEVQKKHPNKFALVKPVDTTNPNVGETVDEWKKQPGAVGIRVMLTHGPEFSPDNPGMSTAMRAAEKNDLPVNMLCWGEIDKGLAMVDRYPNTRFVIDHIGILQPRTPPVPDVPWADLEKVIALASRKNVVIKISGACTLSKKGAPNFSDIWDPLARIFDAWGMDRCLWGTDWTRAHAVVSYEDGVKPFVETDRLSASDREMLMGGATSKTYGWAPS
jgi:predicted TIM-barrel fold metal-dependent hydrolase